MVTIGFDPATHFGFAVFVDSRLKTYGLGDFTKYTDVTERINQIKQQVLELINLYQPEKIVIEDCQLQFNPQVFKFLAKLQGVLVDTFYELGIAYEIISPSTWRSACGIKTRGKKREQLKKEAVTFVERMFNITGDLDDIAEAICIGYYSTKVKKTKSKKS